MKSTVIRNGQTIYPGVELFIDDCSFGVFESPREDCNAKSVSVGDVLELRTEDAQAYLGRVCRLFSDLRRRGTIVCLRLQRPSAAA